jgi:dCTP deaminase
MSIKSDRWIRRMAQEHDMINPFSEKQVSEGVISYGLSSYGYDLRVSDEFKIFTNVNSRSSTPKVRRALLRHRQRRRRHHPAQLLRPGALGRVLQDSARRADHLRRQVHLRALRHHRQRHSLRAGVGGLRHAGDLEHHPAARAHLRQRRPLPDPLLPVGRRVCETSYKDRKGKYQKQKGIVLPKL